MLLLAQLGRSEGDFPGRMNTVRAGSSEEEGNLSCRVETDDRVLAKMSRLKFGFASAVVGSFGSVD